MRVKGSALRSSVMFLREQYPPDVVARVFTSLPEGDASLLTKPILVSDWYDVKSVIRLFHAMAKQTPGAPEDLYHRLGRQSCDDGLNTVYRVFYKIGSPSFILKNAMQLWSNYYDQGKMSILGSDSNSAHLRLVEGRLPDSALCIRVAGWMERAVELSGGKDVRSSHASCVHRGEAHCEWKVIWS